VRLIILTKIILVSWTIDVMGQDVKTATNELGDTSAFCIDKSAYPKKGYKRYGKWIGNNRDKEPESKIKADRKTVLVSFIVHEDGAKTDFEVLKGVGEPYDSEAIRLVRDNPHEWIAAQCGPEKIKTRAVIPIKF